MILQFGIFGIFSKVLLQLFLCRHELSLDISVKYAVMYPESNENCLI